MTQQLIDIAALRREYTKGGLRYTDLTAEPIDLFEQWIKEACIAKLPDATAMSVGTTDRNGQPYQRMVLLKHFDRQGMVFYTNLSSRKAMHLAHNPRISLHFPWNALERQVLVLGHAERLSLIEVMKYFYTRPINSQISALVSHQSSFVLNRKTLEDKFLKLKEKFFQGFVPLPSFWGGYRVNVEAMEFWQGGKYRLHDRFFYRRKKNGWHIERLAP